MSFEPKRHRFVALATRLAIGVMQQEPQLKARVGDGEPDPLRLSGFDGGGHIELVHVGDTPCLVEDARAWCSGGKATPQESGFVASH
jgi:hypothetical protein